MTDPVDPGAGEQPPAGSAPEPGDGPGSYGSIIERFRGTEWDTRTQRLVVPPPIRPSRRVPGAIAAVGVVLLVGAVVAGGLYVIQPAAAPVATPIAAVTPPPTPDPGVPVLAALWDVLDRGTLSYHVEASGSWRSGSLKGSYKLSLDVVGEDYTGTVTETPGLGHSLLIRKDGIVYVKTIGTTKWYSLTTSGDRVFREAPFLGIDDRHEIAYGGPFAENGATLERLVSTALYRPSIGRMLDLYVPELPSAVLKLELVVTADGVPVRATFTGVFDGSPTTITPAFKGTSTYRFSRFGETVVIKAPKV